MLEILNLHLDIEIKNTDLVAAKFMIEKAKTRITTNIALSHRVVPVRLGNSGSPTVTREKLQN
jgi:hypothetical protein